MVGIWEQEITKMSDTLVIYHGNCYDGICAAWVCYKALDEGKNSEVTYIPLNYSDSPPNVKGEDVVIVDFSFKRSAMIKMNLEARSLIVLDHHKTAEEELKGLDFVKFDMNRSGAGLAWDWFFPSVTRPRIVNYIEDRDLWRFQLPDSREINAWIQSFEIDLNIFANNVAPAVNGYSPEIEMAGRFLIMQQQSYTKAICKNARLKEIITPDSRVYKGPYVQTSILMSEVCDYLVKNFPGNYPFAFYSFERSDGKFQYGMRSRSDFDVSEIARAFGGGGHKNAAGFELDEPL